jgi:hypothetical protein
VLPGGLPPPPPCRLSPDPAPAILRLRPTSGRSSNLAIVRSEGRVQGTRLSKATSLAWDQDGFACRWMHVAPPPADGLMHAGVWSGLSFFTRRNKIGSACSSASRRATAWFCRLLCRWWTSPPWKAWVPPDWCLNQSWHRCRWFVPA